MRSSSRLLVALSIAGIAAQGALAADAKSGDMKSIARGRYLSIIGGCNDCHTPWKMGPKGPEPDMSRMLSGHPEGMVLPPAPKPEGPWIVAAAATNTAWSGPWGISFTANLTPDAETGLGKWTEEMFVATVGNGATRNDVAMTATSGSELAGAKLGGPKRIVDWLTQRHPNLVAMPRIYSLALRIVRVATGELDAAIAGGSGHDWDLAAADLLVHEAGGAITGLDGKPLIYNKPEPVHSMLVAAGKNRHSLLVDCVKQAT